MDDEDELVLLVPPAHWDYLESIGVFLEKPYVRGEESLPGYGGEEMTDWMKYGTEGGEEMKEESANKILKQAFQTQLKECPEWAEEMGWTPPEPNNNCDHEWYPAFCGLFCRKCCSVKKPDKPAWTPKEGELVIDIHSEAPFYYEPNYHDISLCRPHPTHIKWEDGPKPGHIRHAGALLVSGSDTGNRIFGSRHDGRWFWLEEE